LDSTVIPRGARRGLRVPGAASGGLQLCPRAASDCGHEAGPNLDSICEDRGPRFGDRHWSTCFQWLSQANCATERLTWTALAGHTLRALQESRGYRVAGSPSLVNDVLIALSARAIGATVLTSNARDFAAIREVRSFELTVVPA